MSVTEGLWLRKIVNDLAVNINNVQIYEDNQGCINIVKNPGNNRRVKHLALKYNFVNDCIGKGFVRVKYIPTTENVADALTKGLPRTLFYRHRQKLGLMLIDFSEEGCCDV